MAKQNKFFSVVMFIPALLMRVLVGLINAFAFIFNTIALLIIKNPGLFGIVFVIFCLALSVGSIWLVGYAIWTVTGWLFT